MRVLRRIVGVTIGSLATSMVCAVTVRSAGPVIVVNEVDVVRLRTSVGGHSASERASLLAQSLEAGLQAGSVRVGHSGTGYRIVVGDQPWLVVSADEARAASTSAADLAQTWAGAIKSAAALPPVKLSARQLKAPVGAVRQLALTGSHVQEAAARSSNERVARVARVGSMLTVEAISPGTAQVSLTSGSSTASLDVTVQPMAAIFPQSIVTYVTGVPATRDTVAGALVSAVNNETAMVDGGQASFSAPAVTEIGTGESRSYSVRLKVSGPQSYPAEGIVNVTVKNSPIGYKGEAELWYSNNPEPVKKAASLFVGSLKAEQPVRMLYHHINASGSTLKMNVEAINGTNETARLLIIPGDAQPAQNPVAAGFEAADRFVRSWAKYSGEIVEIPPYSILPISVRQMRRNDTVSGLCYLRLLEGGPEQVVVRVQTTRPLPVERKWRLAMASPTPWRIAGTKRIGDLATVPVPNSVHIYPNPFKEEDVAYSVGGPYGFVRIGQTPIARRDNQGALDGNFGVVYRINANIENRTTVAAEVELVYEASAGYGGALFLINGDVRRTPMLHPKEETRLSRFRLEPNSAKSLQIMTVPLSGSAYPCTLTIRPVQASESKAVDTRHARS